MSIPFLSDELSSLPGVPTTLEEDADFVTHGDRSAGVIEIIDKIMASD